MYYENELYHHGVKGQKWGVRRYQNADGTLTSAGKRRIKRAEAWKKSETNKYRRERARAVNRRNLDAANKANRQLHALRNMPTSAAARERETVGLSSALPAAGTAAALSVAFGPGYPLFAATLGSVAGISAGAIAVHNVRSRRGEEFASDYRNMSLSEINNELLNERD